MKVVTKGFGTLEVEKVRYRPKGGLYLPFIHNMTAPNAFVRVLSEGPYQGMIAVVHPGYIKHIDVPGLDTHLIYERDVKAFVEVGDGEEFYKPEVMDPVTDPDAEWRHVL